MNSAWESPSMPGLSYMWTDACGGTFLKQLYLPLHSNCPLALPPFMESKTIYHHKVHTWLDSCPNQWPPYFSWRFRHSKQKMLRKSFLKKAKQVHPKHTHQKRQSCHLNVCPKFTAKRGKRQAQPSSYPYLGPWCLEPCLCWCSPKSPALASWSFAATVCPQMHGGFTSAPSPPSPKTKMPRPTIVDRNYIWAFLNPRQCGEKIGHGKVCCKKKIRWNKGVSVHSVSFPPYGIGQFSTISWIISGWFEILIQGGQKFNSVGKLNSIGKCSIQSSSVGTSGNCFAPFVVFLVAGPSVLFGMPRRVFRPLYNFVAAFFAI